MEMFTEPSPGYTNGILMCHKGNPLDALYSFCALPCAFAEVYSRRRSEDECVKNYILIVLSFFVPILGCFCFCQERKKSMEESGGNPPSDVVLGVLSCFCICCMTIQERAKYMKDKGEPKLLMYRLYDKESGL